MNHAINQNKVQLNQPTRDPFSKNKWSHREGFDSTTFFLNKYHLTFTQTSLVVTIMVRTLLIVVATSSPSKKNNDA
ncbi:hypothetical protein DEO72_LG7g449 [Vigna unguiculata]|uniref:Uncharacterized protein n=1 Tax=Vigna unguiculata TaxID=3917 RepID=A0A4D6MFU3_VIGUN|nr:hypothetical protein DEO72_LG7g449 [Vigna unguiculata]